jgi:hypothetical protein
MMPTVVSEHECDKGSCENTFCHMYDVSLPITVTPFATPESPEITCDGELSIKPSHVSCKNPTVSFKYTLTQRIRVEIPARFGAEVCVEEACTEDKGNCVETNKNSTVNTIPTTQ